MVALRWLDRLVGFISIAVLARLLLPADFGVVGYAMLVIALLDMLTGISTDAELIRVKDPDRSHYDAAWTMNIVRGLAIGVLMVALARPAAAFFREARIEAVVMALAIVPIVQGFENTGVVSFRKELAFDREFRFLLPARVLGALATVGLALALRDYWALVAGGILRAALRVGLSYRLHPFRPLWSWERVPEVLKFSRWMMIQNLLNGLNEKMPALVIGREWTSSVLAFFNMGREIAELATTEIRAPIRRVLYPGLTQLAGRQARLTETLVEFTGMFALATLPIPLGIALVAEDLVPLFLGSQWQPMVPLLQPLCIAAAVSALATNSPLAYMALNRAHLSAIAALTRILLLSLCLGVFGSLYGAIGVAYAVAATNVLILFGDYAISSRLLGIGTRQLLAVVWRPVAASLAMCGAVLWLRTELGAATDPVGHVWSLAAATLLGAAVYAACLYGLWAAAGRPAGAERRLVAIAARYFDRYVRTSG